MKDFEKADRDKRNFEERNRLVVVTIAAAGFGLAAAMHLGNFTDSFARSEYKEIPPWLSVFVSMIATLISGYAVFLVAGTLRATIETLEITREMALAQQEAFEIEFRPQIVADEVKVLSAMQDDEGQFVVRLDFTFRNYGKLTALSLSGQILAGDIGPERPINITEYTGFFIVQLFKRSALRPDGLFTEQVDVRGEFLEGDSKLISVSTLFRDEMEGTHQEPAKTYYFLERNDENFELKEAGFWDLEEEDMEAEGE